MKICILCSFMTLVAGCPLPQPLVDVSASAPVTPPRIVVDDGSHNILPSDTLIRVPVGCATPPSYNLLVYLRDVDTTEVDTARWFENYDPANEENQAIRHEDEIAAPPSSSDDPTLRAAPVYVFFPAQFPPESGTGDGVNGDSLGALHIVELVVSNGFDPSATTYPAAAFPYRQPLPDYEVQEFRWIFLGVAQSATVPCPST